MKRFRDPQWFLILMFVGIIASVPLIQLVIEVQEGDGVRAFEVFNKAPTAANLRGYERTMESANWAARVCRPWIQYAHFAWLKDGGEKAVIANGGWFFYKPGLNYMLTRFDKTKTATNDPVAAIVDFRDQLAAQGIKLVVMPVPNKDSIYPDRLTSRVDAGRSVLAPRTQDLREKLRAANVEVIDLFKVFGEARQHPDANVQTPLYLAQDTHWSPVGVDLAAKAVASRLIELGWILPGQVDYSERRAPVGRLGDVLHMLQSPRIESRVPPENVPCVQVVRRDNGELYKDAADAQILVLGDSFMRIYQQDEPRSAGFIAHLAKELKQPMMALVNDGGGSTLVREELRMRPAFLQKRKVVLWEFVERDIGLGIEGWKQVPLPKVVSSDSHGRVNDKEVRGVAKPAKRLN
jgi:hypothetical protein